MFVKVRQPCPNGWGLSAPQFGRGGGNSPTYATPFDAKRPKSAWQHVGEELIYGISHAIAYSINASRSLSAIAEFLFYLTPLSQIYLKFETFEIECFK